MFLKLCSFEEYKTYFPDQSCMPYLSALLETKFTHYVNYIIILKHTYTGCLGETYYNPTVLKVSTTTCKGI